MKLTTDNKIRGEIIFQAIVGSHAHGTNLPESDTDIKGIYIQSPEDVLVHGYQEQVTITDDEVYYELKRVIELCCTGNPTMLELLFSPQDCIKIQDPIIEELLAHRDKFLSKSCKYSFGGYALAQIEKAQGLDKKMNWEKSDTERKDVLDFCNVSLGKGRSKPLKEWLGASLPNKKYGLTSIPNMKDCYAIFWHIDGNFKGIADKDSNQLKLSSIPKELVDCYQADMHFNLDAYSRHCKKYKEYQDWLAKRNTQRYVDINNHGQKIDGKNMLHCIRLITMGKEIAEGKGLIVRRPEFEYLISIRKGAIDLAKLLEQATTLKNEMEELYKTSTLPDKVDRGFFMALIPKIRKKFYKNE